MPVIDPKPAAMGDVALLSTDIVGPGGRVLGIDRDATALDKPAAAQTSRAAPRPKPGRCEGPCKSHVSLFFFFWGPKPMEGPQQPQLVRGPEGENQLDIRRHDYVGQNR